MRVIVVFEFEGVDPNSEKADQIVEVIGKACEPMSAEFGSSACFIDDAQSD